jgi:DNA-binding NarL/FixJ family response regulator
LRAVSVGEVYITRSLAAHLLFGLAESPRDGRPPADPLHELTERERQILKLVVSGRINKEIGQELTLGEKTVKQYMTNVLQKLQVRHRVEAALLAQQRGGAAHG